MSRGLREVCPDTCPDGHDIRAPGSCWVGWSPFWSLRELTCRTCFAADPGAASWAVLDPAHAQCNPETATGRGLELVAVAPSTPTGVGQFVARLASVPIGDLDVAYCSTCRAGLIE